MIEILSMPSGRRVHGDSHRAYCAPGDDEVGFAPVHFRVRCVSPNGYKRRHHEYMLEDREGTHCLWCGELRRMEKIR